MRLKTLALAGTILAAPFLASAASAASIIGLVDGKTIVTIDPATRKVTSEVAVKGASGALLGIDVRPADGMLYGFVADGSIVTIDHKSGQATQKSKLSEPFKAGSDVTFDFNPAADRLRLMSSDGTSLRINVDDGKVTVDGSHKFKEGDANAGKTPKVIAGAYSNSLNPKPAATALYNIDATTWSLVTQAPPNDGVLNTVGALGINAVGAGGVQHRGLSRRQERRVARDRRQSLFGRPEDRQGDARRQARRREGQAFRHRLDRLVRSVGRAVRCPPARLDGPAQQTRPAARAAGRCFCSHPQDEALNSVRPSPS